MGEAGIPGVILGDLWLSKCSMHGNVSLISLSTVVRGKNVCI